MFKKFASKMGGDLIAIVFFLLLALVYFFTPLSEGLVLGGHDTQASVGLGREQVQYVKDVKDNKLYNDETKTQYTRWVNNVFCGMPTYQITPSYNSDLGVQSWQTIFSLGTNKLGHFDYLSYIFLFLFGFYILLRAFNFRPYLAALGAVLWAFSSYFLIIIAAGHIWKVLTLCFIPPTLAGLVLCYRGKKLWGCAVTGIFAALQIHSNHIQMSYYFGFLILLVILCFGVAAAINLWKNTLLPGSLNWDRWWKGTLTFIAGGLLGVVINLPNLYHTYTYSKQSMRGPAELTPLKGAEQHATDGLDRDYITAWSYGIGETMTLMIPDFKGGGSASILDREGADELDGYNEMLQNAGHFQQIMAQQGQQVTPPGISCYWGDQPFTVGPVYVGALVCLLFLLGFFLVRGPLSWALMLATLLSMAFAWGHNFPSFTNFCIDYLPLYNKFRTPSSALVVAEFTMPLLAILGLKRILEDPTCLFQTKRNRICTGVSLALTVGICLLLWLFPSMAGDCLSHSDRELFHILTFNGLSEFATTYSAAVTRVHQAIVAHSAGRSLLILLLGVAAIALYLKKGDSHNKWHKALLCFTLTAICLADLWSVDKNYLNTDSFTDPEKVQELQPTPADRLILKDKSDYRVLDLSQGSPFNETSNHSPYFHQSLGGYHAAKLHRYQDLIERCLNPQIVALSTAAAQAQGDLRKVNVDSLANVINMLNAKYLIYSPAAEGVVLNPAANGNAWFVQRLLPVKNADEEMATLPHLNTKTEAVVDQRFLPLLQGSALGEGTVQLTQRLPNQLTYHISSPKGGVIVLSEIYYPGWEATLDGKKVELARVNYVLRALKVPAGKHQLVTYYKPSSVETTQTIANLSYTIVYLMIAAGIVLYLRKRKKGKESEDLLN